MSCKTPKIKAGNDIPVALSIFEHGVLKDMSKCNIVGWTVAGEANSAYRLGGMYVEEVYGSNPYQLIVRNTANATFGTYYVGVIIEDNGQIRNVDAETFELQDHSASTKNTYVDKIEYTSSKCFDIVVYTSLENIIPSQEKWYGIQWDSKVAASACTRIGNSSLHALLPIQSKMRRCLLSDDGKVVTYLDANDSTKTETGATANLTGVFGQVMVEIPAHYRKFEVDGTVYRCMISEQELSGFTFVPLSYRSAYEAALDRSIADAPKLASVVNTTETFRGGNNNAAWDGTYRSLLGRPVTNASLTDFRNYARNRGEAGETGKGWNCDVYEVQKTCYWLYAIEYANFNCQLDYNPELDPNGYRQGGLSIGVTNMNNWGAFNKGNPFVPCGQTNSLGNNSGVVEYTYINADGTKGQTFSVPSYRGLENPFGHIWSWMDGCKCLIQNAAAGGASEFYVCDNPANYQDTDYNNYIKRGKLPRSNGYVKVIIAGEFAENMPAEVGGSSSTYFADFFITNIPSSGIAQRGVLFGGDASSNMNAGFNYANTIFASSVASANIGSRLCFLPS